MKKSYLLVVLALFIMNCLSAQFTLKIELTTDEYPEETSWNISDVAGVILSGDNYTAELTLFEDSIEVSEGNYSFSINDEYGDGICCEYGDGFYVLSEVSSGLVISEGSDFGSVVDINFSLPYVPPVMGCTDPGAINYDADAEADDGSCEYLLSALNVSLNEVANGFGDIVDLVNAGDDRLFVVEQDGIIKILNSDYTTESTAFINIDPLTNGGGERGLLGLAFHPNYLENGYFFVSYTNTAGNSVVARYSVSEEDPNIADPVSAEIIFQQNQPYSNHNAGDLAFGPDGYLYIPMGDGGSAGDPENRAQNPATLLGKMLRIDVDGEAPYSIPEDNPFVNESSTLDEIWAIGLRNTWKFSFDAETGDMWMGDVGQNVWEEIDFEPANSPGGVNYGWRCTEGLVDFNTAGCPTTLEIEDPVAVYNHSGGACSVTGGYVYRGEDYPAMQGKYFFTDYCNGQFVYLEQDFDGNWESQEFLGPQGFGWSTFGENVNNELFVANLNGTIYRLEDECVDFTAEITFNGGQFSASMGDSYIWLLFGEIIEGATDQTYVPTEGGTYSVLIENGDGCTAISNEIEIVTGISEFYQNSLKIVPNPAKNYISVDISENHEVVQINIYSLMGQLVRTISANDYTGNIQVNELQNGVYILELVGNDQAIRSRFAVSR